MDDLDRMFQRLVQNIRNGYPEYLTQPFDVSELYQSLIPYRHNRRELAIDSAEDYESVLCRLLAGERTLLAGDDVMCETIREELQTPNPNTTIYREFASSRVVLVPDAVRRVDTPGGLTGPPSPSAAANAASNVRASSRPPEHIPPPPVAPRPSAKAPAPPATKAPAAAGTSAATSSPRRSEPLPSPPPRPSGRTPAPPAAHPAGAGPCRFCGGALPTERRVVFCPNCGQNLAIHRCPACGSELEISWKFCVTCGRSAGST